MRRRSAFLLASLVAASAPGATAQAQEVRELVLPRTLPTPSHALELSVGTGYTQGFGMLAPKRTVAEASGAGIGVGLALDYRLDATWSFGLEGQYQEYESRQNASARGLALQAGATYHFAPVQRGDPWLRLGTGYRSVFESGPPGAGGTDIGRHGLELVAARFGYDVRVVQDVAIAPVIGADLDLFVWNDGSGAPGAMSAAQPAVFAYAGLQGRFDLGGTRARPREAEGPPIAELVGVTAPQPESSMLPPPPVEGPQSPPPNPSVVALAECRRLLGSIAPAPRFDEASTELRPGDYGPLRRLGECLTTGPLRAARLQLVGHADARGSFAHNLELGRQRAARVSSALQLLGVDASRIEVTSRGSLDAQRGDAALEPLDRRVDIVER